ncbi:hypothetical protein FQR65_LT11333 [Abscondita terminalis]|nr:hypothetical protein FQR65_LT11333 [Abscondita terminalis]
MKFDNICTACLRADEALINMHQDNIIEKFLSCTGLTAQNDYFNLCRSCEETLNLAYDFKVKCLNSHQVLLSYAEEEDVVVKNEHVSSTEVSQVIENLKQNFYVNTNCIQCGFVASNSLALSIHVSLVHKDLKGRWCRACNVECDDLPNHLETHHGDEATCNFCNKKFRSKARLAEHLPSHSDQRNFQCPFCSKTFILQRHLNVHVRKHNEDKSYKCHVCDMSFVQLRQLKKHLKGHEVSGKKTLCNVCGKEFKTVTKLKVHMRVHTGETPYKCSYCPKSVATRNQLVVHERTHTGEKPHVCHVCGKSFAQSSVLTTHMRLHTGPTITCKICNQKFCRESQLRLHLRRHTGEKPYRCTECGKSFIQRSHLVEHNKTHSDLRPHQCSYCDKAFKKSSSLKQHVQIHLGETPYKCNQCSYACRQSHSLTQHMKQHAADRPRSDRPHACTTCNKKFSTSALLVSHSHTMAAQKFLIIAAIAITFLMNSCSVDGRYLPTRSNTDRLDKLKELLKEIAFVLVHFFVFARCQELFVSPPEVEETNIDPSSLVKRNSLLAGNTNETMPEDGGILSLVIQILGGVLQGTLDSQGITSDHVNNALNIFSPEKVHDDLILFRKTLNLALHGGFSPLEYFKSKIAFYNTQPVSENGPFVAFEPVLRPDVPERIQKVVDFATEKTENDEVSSTIATLTDDDIAFVLVHFFVFARCQELFVSPPEVDETNIDLSSLVKRNSLLAGNTNETMPEDGGILSLVIQILGGVLQGTLDSQGITSDHVNNALNIFSPEKVHDDLILFRKTLNLALRFVTFIMRFLPRMTADGGFSPLEYFKSKIAFYNTQPVSENGPFVAFEPVLRPDVPERIQKVVDFATEKTENDEVSSTIATLTDDDVRMLVPSNKNNKNSPTTTVVSITQFVNQRATSIANEQVSSTTNYPPTRSNSGVPITPLPLIRRHPTVLSNEFNIKDLESDNDFGSDFGQIRRSRIVKKEVPFKNYPIAFVLVHFFVFARCQELFVSPPEVDETNIDLSSLVKRNSLLAGNTNETMPEDGGILSLVIQILGGVLQGTLDSQGITPDHVNNALNIFSPEKVHDDLILFRKTLNLALRFVTFIMRFLPRMTADGGFSPLEYFKSKIAFYNTQPVSENGPFVAFEPVLRPDVPERIQKVVDFATEKTENDEVSSTIATLTDDDVRMLVPSNKNNKNSPTTTVVSITQFVNQRATSIANEQVTSTTNYPPTRSNSGVPITPLPLIRRHPTVLSNEFNIKDLESDNDFGSDFGQIRRSRIVKKEVPFKNYPVRHQ